ncbi:hypothetical protein ACJX0J_019042 [Zea mays]
MYMYVFDVNLHTRDLFDTIAALFIFACLSAADFLATQLVLHIILYYLIWASIYIFMILRRVLQEFLRVTLYIFHGDRYGYLISNIYFFPNVKDKIRMYQALLSTILLKKRIILCL